MESQASAFETWLRQQAEGPVSQWTAETARWLLRESVFYPCSGKDGRPVQCLGRDYQSYVYVDYGHDEHWLDATLEQRPFAGYGVAVNVAVDAGVLLGCSWEELDAMRPAGELARIQSAQMNSSSARANDQWARWLVFRREPNRQATWGPAYFSLLYVCAEALAVFRRLYVAANQRPAVLCLISPTTGYGGNWDEFAHPTSALAEAVLTNPAGIPRYLLVSDRELTPGSGACWPEYAEQQDRNHGQIWPSSLHLYKAAGWRANLLRRRLPNAGQ